MREGSAWDEADQATGQMAVREGLTYVHTFADPAVVARQGTIGLEILEDASETDIVLVAIGGRGLVCGAGSEGVS